MAAKDATIKPGRLLVLDDEPDVAATICMMAATASFETDHTDNTHDFFARLISWQPTHIAVDLKLADIDGIDVIHALAESGCNATLIIVSGLGDRILESSARAAVENGLRFAGTLAKPFSRSGLLNLLTAEVPQQVSAQLPLPTTRQLPVTAERLATALQAKALVADYQPKISCGSGRLIGYECLARWPQPDGGNIPPDAFIGVAEQTGQIHELTRQIYEYALANVPEAGCYDPCRVALNLSPLNLSDPSFPAWLVDKCSQYGIAPSRVILEMTETASLDNPLALLEDLTRFRIKGFHLSIDDFGVGYSSLVQLARLPFSELKIDQMFVRTLSTSEESRKIVTAVLGLGKSLGLNVVAEGVEDAPALSFLQEAGCDAAQGFHIARPMSSLAAAEWAVRQWRKTT